MDELKQIQSFLATEKDSFVESMASRTKTLEGYSTILDKVKKQVEDIAIFHREEVVKLLNEKEALTKEMQKEKENHEAKLTLLTKACSDKDSELKEKEAKLADLNSQEVNVNKKIDTLMIEHREVDTKMATLRVNYSVAERKYKDLGEQEKNLTKSITEKTIEEVKLSDEIESKQKQSARLSNDIAILEARKTK